MIKKVIENKVKADIQRDNGLTVYPTEEILGSLKSIKDFAAFYVSHKTDLEVIKAHYLLQYCEYQSFTPEQKSAFQMGLDTFPVFFKSAESDVHSYLLEAESKKKSVG